MFWPIEALSSCRFVGYFSSSVDDAIVANDNREASPVGLDQPILFIVCTLDIMVLLGITDDSTSG